MKLRMEIGKPATITVRIDLRALPEDARPESVSVWMLPADAAQWMSKPGVPAPQCTRGYGRADASNGWTILLGDVTPDVPISIRTSSRGGKDSRAEAVVTVGFGEEKEITLKPVVSAKVTFVKPEHAPPGGVVISIKRPDGTWEPIEWSTVWEDGKEWKVERDVLPGRLLWRAERFALGTEPEERVALGMVEGEVEAAAGESREVRIVFSR